MGAGQRLTCDRYFHNVHIRLVSPQVLVSLITSNILTISKKTRERKNDRVSNPSTHTVVSECWKKKLNKKQREQSQQLDEKTKAAKSSQGGKR
jgi:hypothetical protein